MYYGYTVNKPLLYYYYYYYYYYYIVIKINFKNVKTRIKKWIDLILP